MQHLFGGRIEDENTAKKHNQGVQIESAFDDAFNVLVI